MILVGLSIRVVSPLPLPDAMIFISSPEKKPLEPLCLYSPENGAET